MGRYNGSIRTAGGLSKKEKFYGKYSKAMVRITDPKNKDYHNYGGRVLTFKWKNYLDFKKDMYKSYLKHCKIHGKNNTTLERVNNDKGYSKENCRWATFEEQAKNRRTNIYITYKGETMIIADWARRLKISRQSVRYRLEKGWDIESIINTPFKYSNRYDKKNKIIRTPKTIFVKKSRKSPLCL
jgi:primosomal protein N'